MTYREFEDSREVFSAAEQAAYEAEYNEYLDELEAEAEWEYEDDGQPSEYEEWQDYMGGDDWDHGQYDDAGDYF